MLPIGTRAPDFELTDDRGNAVRLADLLKDGPVVLFFYPMDFTSLCTREACMFRDVHGQLLRGGVRVVGINHQASGSHARFRERNALPFALLADPGKKTARSYGATGYFGLATRRVSYYVDRDGVIQDAARGDFRLEPHEGFVQRVLRRREGAAG